MFDSMHDARVRSAAFEWLSSQVAGHGDVLPRAVLAEGFTLDGIRVPLIGPQGIFKPRVLQEVPLSITNQKALTTTHSGQADSFATDIEEQTGNTQTIVGYERP